MSVPNEDQAVRLLRALQESRLRIEQLEHAAACATTPRPGPVLGSRLRLPLSTEARFHGEPLAEAIELFAEHVVDGRPLFPAAGYVEMALEAARAVGYTADIELRELTFSVPLELEAASAPLLQTIVTPVEGGHAVRIVQLTEGDEAAALVVSQCRLGESGARRRDALRLADASGRCSEVLDAVRVYGGLAGMGFAYGPQFRTIAELGRGEGIAWSRLTPPAATVEYLLHPALLDGLLQTAAGTVSLSASGAVSLSASGSDVRYLPEGIDRICWRGGRSGSAGGGRNYWAVANRGRSEGSDSAAHNSRLYFDVTLFDDREDVIVEIEGLRVRRVTPAARPEVFDLVCRPAGTAAATPARIATRWLLIAAPGDTPRLLADRLAARGGQVTVVEARSSAPGQSANRSVDLQSATGVAQLLQELSAGGQRPDVVVDLSGLEDAVESGPEAGESERGLRASIAALHVAQALAGLSGPEMPSLWLVGRGGLPSSVGAPSPTGAAVASLARTIGWEHPELTCRYLDFDPGLPAAAQSALAVEAMLAADDEPAVALRDGQRHWPRLTRRASLGADGANLRFEVGTPGVLESIAARARDRVAPGRGEVELQVAASSLNFRDVMNALGLYPGPAVPLGAECSGTVVRVGADVTGLTPGDRVIALAPGCFATFVTTPAELVVRQPDGLRALEASTLPVAFLTACVALDREGKLSAGQRVLVHAASGGVGLAAVQLARLRGAEVFATAGSEVKRDYLRRLGIRHVYDSRTLAFADQIPAAAGGGVDLVLNSLTGPFIPAGLQLLNPGGHFLEIGKTELWDDERVRALRSDVRYSVIEFEKLVEGGTGELSELMGEVFAAVGAGKLSPLPRRVYPIDSLEQAVRTMAQARHIGKIVLRHPEPPSIRPDATYLITGGLGALGLKMAGRLVERGARALVLCGRRGPGEAAARSIDSWRQAGVDVRIAAVDVGDRPAMERLVASIPRERPLRGVIHAAGVIDDALLNQQSAERFRLVWGPKAGGAEILDRVTQDCPLDFFVLCSSLAAVVGSPGQGNYAAASGYLDGLARRRWWRGAPAAVINWTAWEGEGMASRASRGHIPALGGWLEPESGLDALDRILAEGLPQAVVAASNWMGERPAFALPSLISELVSSSRDALSISVESLRALPGPERRPAIRALVLGVAARVMGLPDASSIDAGLPISELGLDSLMAVELTRTLGSALDRKLPATVLFNHPTLDALVDHLASLVQENASEGPELATTTTFVSDRPARDDGAKLRPVEVDAIPEEIASLTDNEAADLLQRELAAAEQYFENQ